MFVILLEVIAVISACSLASVLRPRPVKDQGFDIDLADLFGEDDGEGAKLRTKEATTAGSDKKVQCGPIRFPEFSCEEDTAPSADTTPWALMAELISPKFYPLQESDSDSGAATTTPFTVSGNIKTFVALWPSVTFATNFKTNTISALFEKKDFPQRKTESVMIKRDTKTAKTTQKAKARITFIRPLNKKIASKFRQFLQNQEIVTSSTRPYGWESTTTNPSSMPEACNNLAKCDTHTWRRK